MVDRIVGNKGFGSLGNANRTSNKANIAKKADSTPKSDRVDFSSALQNATKTQAASESQETGRSEKVQELKAQIENGSYQPDLNKVASSLMPFIMKDS